MSIDAEFEREQLFQDLVWRNRLQAGQCQRGDLQTDLEFLARTQLIRPRARVLEIGCGVGTLAAEMAKQGCDVTGIDISRVAIVHGLQTYSGIQLEVQPAEGLSYEAQYFDIVLSFDVLEHIPNVDRHLAEVHRVLVPGGYYLLGTPNEITYTLWHVLSHGPPGWRRSHPSLRTPKALKRQLREHGFDVRFIKMNPNEFTLGKARRGVGRLGAVLRYMDFRKLPLRLQTGLYVVAQKK